MPFESSVDLVQQWLIRAKSDLELARVNLPDLVLLETLRYPSFSEPVDCNNYEVALQLADRTFLWAKSIIDSP